MSDDDKQLARRVGAAAASTWWTVLIGGVWATISWLGYLCIMKNQPKWIMRLWGGGDLGWNDVQDVCLLFFGIFKLVLWVTVMLAIWLTLYSRRLRRID